MGKCNLRRVAFFFVVLLFTVVSIFLLMNLHVLSAPFHGAYEFGRIESGKVWWTEDVLGEEKSINLLEEDFGPFTDKIESIVQEAGKHALAHAKTMNWNVLDFLGVTEKQIDMIFPIFGLTFVGTKGEVRIDFYEATDGFTCGIEYRCRKAHNAFVRTSCVPYCYSWTDTNDELRHYIEGVISEMSDNPLN